MGNFTHAEEVEIFHNFLVNLFFIAVGIISIMGVYMCLKEAAIDETEEAAEEAAIDEAENKVKTE